MRACAFKIAWICFFLGVIGLQSLQCQYFGMNKPQYKTINYSLFKTPHFDIYHYFKDSTQLAQMAADCERWYFYHQQILTDTFKTPNPVIVYTNHADFQQTTAISGSIDVGTGGVTEGLKRRVTFPTAFTRNETDHVLGHEMVHAFQYHIITESLGMNVAAIQQVPLFMIEGMAEYLSIGSVSSHTSLWMRDALIHHQFPDLRTLTYDYRYSPYRYGHAFWAWVASRYGEQYISRLFTATAMVGIEEASVEILGLSTDSISRLWESDLRQQLLTKSTDKGFTIIGKRLINSVNGGRYNISPSISPNGNYLIFMSERDVYSLDLFLANAHTGEVVKTLYTSTRYDEVDALSLLESTGTWSPDSRKFAYVGFVKGKTTLLIFDLHKGKITRQIPVPDVDAVAYPAWSPDGKTIVFTGLVQGKSGLYTFNLHDKMVTPLCTHIKSAVMPVWSPDGKMVWFSTEELAPGQSPQGFPFMNIASVDLSSGEMRVYETMNGARNINPVVMNGGKEVMFLSDGDGRRNLYGLDIETETLYKVTDYPTGICGISEYSPSLSVAGDTLVYSMLWYGRFEIFKTDFGRLSSMQKEMKKGNVDYSELRLMPYSSHPSTVETNLFFKNMPQKMRPESFYQSKIEPKFKLDYIGNMSAGVMAGRYGAGIAGSIEAMFSDILGNNVLYTAASINGEVYDFGGQIAYLNQKHRVKTGASLSHIPYHTGSLFTSYDTTATGALEQKTSYLYRRTFEEKASVFAYYPFNRTRRVEMGLSYAMYSYRDEVIADISSYDEIYYRNSKKVASPPGFQVGIVDFAFVIDNARFGLASPVDGRRLRIQVEQYMSGINMQTLLIDYRRYFLVKPTSFAFRLYHYGRYGNGSDSQFLMDMFLGYPWYLRGYDSGTFYGDEAVDPSKISVNQLIGNRLLLANVEWRLPFTGPPEIALVNSGSFYSEMALFIDCGVAWDNQSRPTLSFATRSIHNRIPLYSMGLAYRINLFGAIVIEPYLAFPILQEEVKPGHLGINLFAGW